MINLKEFAVFLQQIDLQPALSTSSIRQLFTVFDETHSGFINFFEFCHVVFPDLGTPPRSPPARPPWRAAPF